MKVIYKITYPNGKIYVDKDLAAASTALSVLTANSSREIFHGKSAATSPSEKRFLGNLKLLQTGR